MVSLDLDAYDSEEIFKALSSPTRLKILKLLSQRELNINELGQSLDVNLPTISKHVQALEQADLVTSEYMAGAQGTQKRCKLKHRRIILSFDESLAPADQSVEIEMPIGLYTLVNPGGPTCGIAGSDGFIGLADEPQAFLVPDRHKAQILWMADGFVEYMFPNKVPTSVDIWKAEVQMEVCSECPGYKNDYPSDITVWINGVEIGTWTSPGDLGGRRGRLNPSWWNDHQTQYGALKSFSVSSEGAFVDGVQLSAVTIKDAMIAPQHPISIRIGVKPDARHPGGFNLFGKGFGNYQQDLLVRLHYIQKLDVRPRTTLAVEHA